MILRPAAWSCSRTLRARRHLRHEAVRVQAWQIDGLPRLGQERGGFAHKIDTAKNNEIRVNLGHAPGQLQRIARDVAVLHHGVILVVVAHDAEFVAQLSLDSLNFGTDILHGLFPALKRCVLSGLRPAAASC